MLKGSPYRTDVVLSLLGQQQQFHFAFGQRPFPFPPDPLGGFRMPPITTCQSKYLVMYICYYLYILLNKRLQFK